MKSLTRNQTGIINSIIKEFKTSNDTVKEPSGISFFDDLIIQSEIDLKEIAELKQRRKIGNDFIKSQTEIDYNILKPHIDKIGLGIKLFDTVIHIGSGYYENGLMKNVTSFRYIEDTVLKTFPSGKTCYEYMGYNIIFNRNCKDVINNNLNDLINCSEFQELIKQYLNEKNENN